jgi:uncharacterized membrane protein YgcG
MCLFTHLYQFHLELAWGLGQLITSRGSTMKRLLASFTFLMVGLVITPTLVAQTTIVDHLTMNQWVSPVTDGVLEGQVFLPEDTGQSKALTDISIAIMSRDGKVLRGKTNEKGEFTIKDVVPGIYALTARGDNVFACCAMHVIERIEGFPSVAEVSVANVDYTVVNTAIIRYLPPNVQSSDVSISNIKLDALANQVCGNELFRVAQFNGGMKGRLHLAGAVGTDLQGADLTNVFIFKDGMQIDRAVTDEKGQFAINKIDPGFYSLLAIGNGGVGLIGFELVDESALTETVSNQSADGSETLVGLRHRHKGGCCCQEFAMQVAPMPEIVSCVEEVIVEQPVAGCGGCGTCDACVGVVDTGVVVDEAVVMDGFGTPVAGGGFVPGGGFSGGGGGFSGGGGGGFGGGGLASLIPLITLPFILDEIDDDDPIIIPVAASPGAP